MKVIYEGTLTRSSERFYVRRLSKGDISSMIEIQEKALQVLENSELLQPVSSEEFLEHEQTGSLMVGAFVANRLVAFRTLLIPPIDENHIGYDVGLRKDQFHEIIYQEITIVVPEYRGNRLQMLLGQVITEELHCMYPNRFKYVCCTVSPYNIPSLKDKFAQRMEILNVKEKYGGKLRFIFMQVFGQTNKYYEILEVGIHDYELQQQLLTQGYVGFEMVSQAGKYMIQFGKKENS